MLSILLSPPGRTGLSGVAIVFAVTAAWWGSVPAPFVLDDQESILTNASIRELASFGWITPPASGGETVSGRPVLNASFAVNYALGGLDVRGYRAGNILLHALAALALFGVIRRTCGLECRGATAPVGPGRSSSAFALAAALLWAVHPLQTSAVTYVAQRAESMAGLFYLLTLYCFIRSLVSPRHRAAWSAGCVVSCLLGAGTKETIVTAPVVVLLYDRVFCAGSFRAAWRARGWLHLALATSWLPLAALVIGSGTRGGSAGFDSGVEPLEYLLTQADAITRYLTLAAWPARQVFDYGAATVGNLSGVAPQIIFLCGLLAGVFVLLSRNRVAGFLAGCFFLLLAPSSSVVPVATQTMAEHRMYLALAPLLVLGCAAIERLGTRGRAYFPATFLVAVLPPLLLATQARNHVYRSDLSLWRDTVAKRPENPRAHYNLGLALHRSGQRGEAAVQYRRTLELQPHHAFAHANLGAILLAQGRWSDAERHLAAALNVDPQQGSARVNLAHAVAQQGRADEAVHHYRAALELTDTDAAHEARVNLAAVLLAQGGAREAETLLRIALASRPDDGDARRHLGRLLEQSGALAAAEAEYRAAVRLQPDSAGAHLALGHLLARRGDAAGAEGSYREAIREAPGLSEAHYSLGNVLARQRQFEPAADAFREALRLDPAHAQARNNLANSLLASGRVDEAVALYEAVLRERPDDEAVLRNLEIARELGRSRGPAGR